MFLQKKRNYHETIHDGAMGMISRLVGFLINKPRIACVINLVEAKPSRANFLTAVAFSKRV